jgi:alpha-tubulin suppressor-like RCC1 family protein
MSVSLRKVASIILTVAVAATMSCRDDGITPPGTSAEPEGLIVSSPVLLSSGSSESVVFVSLMPGTAPSGVRANIQNRASGEALIHSPIADGFDPVAIAAQVGDSIEVLVTNATTAVVFHAVVAVRSLRPPVVVRTNPRAQTIDASLNTTIQVVFSAPIDSTTLTPLSIQLLRGRATPVAGTLEFSDWTTMAVEFHPTELLAANTAYRIVAAQSIRDVNQVALESPVSVDFSTGKDPLATAKLVFLAQPTNTIAGVAFSPPVVVAVQDASGSAITYATGPVRIEWQGGSTAGISGTRTVNAVNGVATFDDLSIERAGSQFTLVASYPLTSPELTSIPSSRFSVDPAAPSKLEFRGPSSVDATTQFAASILVSDAFGNIVRNAAANPVTLSLNTNPGGATLGGTLSAPVFNGVATFTKLTLDRPGLGYVLQATSGSWSGNLKLDVWNEAAFAEVSAGGAHTCAVARNQYAYCWGANAHGQVGAGTTIDYASPVIVAAGITSVSAGGNHSCAFGAGLYCWGLNSDGQLGDGTKIDRLRPTRTTGPFADVYSVRAGGAHSCGDKDDGGWDSGTVSVCWGSDAYGQLGYLADSPTVYALVAGGSHSCGTDYGFSPQLYCWGSNVSGQLGTGTTLTMSRPVLHVGSLSGDWSLSAGRSHTCAGLNVLGIKGLFCWGSNDAGQLGDGTTVERRTPVLVSGGPFASVSAGGSHTCALNSAGAAYCWGANDHGQLGDGTPTTRTTPVLVAGGLTFLAVSAGGSHSCGVTVSGTYCWGANGNGQLGNGTTTDSAVPVRVSGQ